MIRKPKNLAALFEKIGLCVVGILSAAFAFFLTAVGMLQTTVADSIGPEAVIDNAMYHIMEEIESVYYVHDNLFVNLFFLAVYMLVLFFLAARIRKLPLRWLKVGLFIWTFLLGTVWVISSQSSPSHDSLTVTSAAIDFGQDNYSVLYEGNYFQIYPFQLGFVFFCEKVILFLSKFKELKTLIPLEILNALFLGIIHVFLVKICEQVFGDERVNRMAVLLLALSAAPLISCSFIYGIFPGMAFAVIALYCEIRYLKEGKVIHGACTVLSIAFSILLKPNYLIWLITIVLLGIVKLPGRKKYVQDAGFLLAAVILSACVQPMVQSHYEKRSGKELGDSIPYVSWIAMGLSESQHAPGWNNPYVTIFNFEECGSQTDAAAERSSQLLKNRLDYFLKHPQYTTDFFFLKIVSQWNETSYQSIWNNTVRGQYRDKGSFAAWVCGDGKRFVKKGMDFFAQLIFMGFTAGCIFMLKKKQFLMTPLPVVFLGGFFYQLISEGKSQYILPYFIVMTAFAAFGLVCLLDSFATRAGQNQYAARLLAIIAPGSDSGASLRKADAAAQEAETASAAADDAVSAGPDTTKQKKKHNKGAKA